MTDAHYVLFKALVLHVFTPIFFKSNLTSSSHLNLGLTLFLLPPDLSSIYFLTGLSPFTLTTFPSHSNLHTLITVTVSGDAVYYKFVDSFIFSRTLKCELGKLLNSYHDMCLYIVCGQVCCPICFQFLWILWLCWHIWNLSPVKGVLKDFQGEYRSITQIVFIKFLFSDHTVFWFLIMTFAVLIYL